MLNVFIERIVKAAAVKWDGHVLQREEGDILKEALNFEATGKKKEIPKAIWSKPIETKI